MKTRILSLALVLMLALTSVVGCSTTTNPEDSDNQGENEQASGTKFTAGTYTSTTTGRNGELKLSVTVSDDKIEDIEILEHSETATICETPLNQIPETIIADQTLDVDMVSGATITSVAVVNAVRDALEQAGADIDSLSEPVEKEITPAEDVETEIVIVGAGSAGMIAAIKAAEAGKDVLLVEKQGFLGGGDTMFASTSIRAGGTRFQEDLEGQTGEDFYKYLEAKGQEYYPDVVSYETLRTYAEKSGEMVNWLTDLGVPFGSVIESSFSIKTLDGSAPGTHIVKALGNRIDELGIEYRLNTKATSILMDDGEAVGVEVEGPDGNYNINAQATIICTGGYANNPDLVAEYAPQWSNRPTTGASSLTGDGILMAEEIGAKITNMDQVKANPLCYVYKGTGVSLTAITDYCVLINHEGNRFVDESAGTVTSRSEAMMEQTNNEAYSVFDQTVIDDLALMSGYNDSGYFLSADSLEELADLMDVDKETFLATMEAYQTAGETGEDKEFNRDITDPIDTPKYYAALVTPSMQSTYGGITVDIDGRVIDTNDQVIPGLYAAGATSGHSACAGSVGAALIVAVVFGDVVGETAAAEIN
jgi:fumarate reductase flavoprotein subunit